MAMRRVQPGQRFEPRPAREENAVSEAAEWVAAQKIGNKFDTPRGVIDTGRCLVANPTCDDWERFDVVELLEPIVRPSKSLETWASGLPTYRASVPTGGHGRIAVITEPLPSCLFARAIAAGIVRTIVDMQAASHRFARPVAGSSRLESTSSTSAPCEIIWVADGLGERYADVRISNAGTATGTTAPATTTTLPAELEAPDCSGKCKWTSYDGIVWYPTPVSTCADAATTTGAPTTTTTGAPTTTTTACCPDLETDADPTSTTTALAPTTTTTPDECECSYPTFCPTAIDQCTYTQCVRGANNEMPNCAGTTTTAAPVTSTTCDCNTVVAPDPCSLGCDYVGLPSSGGTWSWHRTSNGCTASCPCPVPITDPYCATAHTDCVLIPPVYPPPPPVCSGSCVWIWIDAISSYYRTGSGCNTQAPDCSCQPPSIVSPCGLSGCCEVMTPCVSPIVSPTTGTTSEFDGCQYTCLGLPTTTTTAGPVTTTTVGCDNGGCTWASNPTATGWTGPSSDTCPAECPCEAPSRNPYDACEVIVVGCFGSPTTTTTAGPTTTTAAPTTTTTTACLADCEDEPWADPFDANKVGWLCMGNLGWIACRSNCDPGCVPVEPPSLTEPCEYVDCGNRSTSFCDCPTTTTAAPTTTPTPAPTTTTPGGPTTGTTPL